MEYESAFVIHGSDNVIRKLQILFKKKCILTVHYGYDDETFVTTIFELNLTDDSMVFFHSPKESKIRELLNSDLVTFEADYLGIKIAFDAYRVDKYKNDGLSAFSIPIPNKLLWIEARDSYRIRTLDSLSGYCHLTIENTPEPFIFKLYDISISGFSILIDNPEISNLLMLDTCFDACKIVLEQAGEGYVSIEVKSRTLINPDDPKRFEKVGCKFTKISPVFEDSIHRYMGKVEIESRQK